MWQLVLCIFFSVFDLGGWVGQWLSSKVKSNPFPFTPVCFVRWNDFWYFLLQQAVCDEDWVRDLFFLWGQSNHGGGPREKGVSCLMVCLVFFEVVTFDVSNENIL